MILTLKELLTPPFEIAGHSIMDSTGIILATLWADNSIIATDYKRGRDIFQPQKIINDFVLEAINEKYERDFAEPMRWRKIIVNGKPRFKCDRCTVTYRNITKNNSYCTNCGQRLLTAEERKETR